MIILKRLLKSGLSKDWRRTTAILRSKCPPVAVWKNCRLQVCLGGGRGPSFAGPGTSSSQPYLQIRLSQPSRISSHYLSFYRGLKRLGAELYPRKVTAWTDTVSQSLEAQGPATGRVMESTCSSLSWTRGIWPVRPLMLPTSKTLRENKCTPSNYLLLCCDRCVFYLSFLPHPLPTLLLVFFLPSSIHQYLLNTGCVASLTS